MKIDVTLSPQFELCFALGDLASPNPHFAGWPGISGRPDWLEEARAFGWVFWIALPELVDRSHPVETTEQFIAALKSVPEKEVVPRLRRSLVNRPSTRVASAQMREWLHFIGLDTAKPDRAWGKRWKGPLDSPLAILNAFRPYFDEVWAELRPSLAESAKATAGLIGRADLHTVAADLELGVEFDDRTQVMRTLRGYKVQLTEIGTMFLLPSAFNSRRFMALSDFTEQKSLFIPYLLDQVELPCGLRRTADFGIELDPWLVCRAIGNPTRAAILQLIGDRPRPAFEIMRELNLSKANVSHHIFQLREAGLVIERRVGRTVELAVRMEPFRGLSRALTRELGRRRNG